MSRLARWLVWLTALLLAVWLGRHIVRTTLAQQRAVDEPRAALALDANNPPALLALAHARLDAGEPAAAAGTARHLLRVAPLQAAGFSVLARAARQRDDSERAAALVRLAVRRAPRDQLARAWLIGGQLRAGQFDAALTNVDVLLRMAPPRARVLLPLLVPLAPNPDFATALAEVLAARPGWRGSMLDLVLAQAEHAGLDRVFSAVQTHGGLDAREFGRWLQRLGKAGRWGEAYSRWAGQVTPTPGAGLPLLYNGGFEQAPTPVPFDWQMRGQPGTLVQRTRGNGGHVAEVRFFGRRANDMHFGQTLLLAPGRYRLTFQARARRLRSDRGLAWAVHCLGEGGQRIGTSPRLRDSFDWTTMQTTFVVPPHACPAQRLALTNPGAAAAGKIVSGTLWLDDFHIQAVNDEGEG